MKVTIEKVTPYAPLSSRIMAGSWAAIERDGDTITRILAFASTKDRLTLDLAIKYRDAADGVVA